MSEDHKLKVEGFDRIKLKTREDAQENSSTVAEQSDQSKMGDSSAPVNTGSVVEGTSKVIEQLAQQFSPQFGGDDTAKQPQVTSTGSENQEDGAQKDGASNNAPRSLVNPPALPTQVADYGIHFDFNFAMRVSVPKPAEGEGWRVQFFDQDTSVILLDQPCFDMGHAATSKHHFLRGKIVVSKILKDGTQQEVLAHEYNATGKEVLIVFPVGSLGDSLGWMPYAERFRKKHNCKLTVAIGAPLVELFEKSYPDVTFINSEDFAKQPQSEKEKFYASYYIGLFFDDEDNHWQPHDFRQVGLHRTAGYILGVDPTEEPPKLTYSEDTRPIEEPYVVIATQASTQCKYWNNPYGWHKVIEFLKSVGYRVICIDKEMVYGRDLVWNHMPHGAEDQTGARSLTERARWLRHAEFFIGLSSGLAWLAWGAGIPVVIISGFTHPSTEFNTPYRVFSTHVCNGCWNDIRHKFDHQNFLFCPRHRDTPRQFECTKGISHQHVIDTILKIPGCRKEPITTT